MLIIKRVKHTCSGPPSVGQPEHVVLGEEGLWDRRWGEKNTEGFEVDLAESVSAVLSA